MKKLPFPKEEWIYKQDGIFSVSKIIRNADWDDLGFVEREEKHDFCGKDLKVGREDGKLFLYCPRCEVKTKDFPTQSNAGSAPNPNLTK